MRTPWYRWNLMLAAVAATGVLALLAVNVLSDPYLVLHTSSLRPGTMTNERYNKIEHVLANPRRYDAFLVGSSVIGVFDPHTAERLRPGHRYYNLGVFSGTPADAHRMLLTLARHGVTIREVVLGLDFFPFAEATDSTHPSFRQHPLVTGTPAWRYRLAYLLQASFLHAANKIVHHLAPQPVIEFDFANGGNWRAPHWEQAIQAGQTIAAAAHTQGAGDGSAGVTWVPARFEELAALVEWLQERDTTLYAFIHPAHPRQREIVGAAGLREFRTRIRRILPGVVDFTDTRTLAEQRHYFYETKHYRPILADIVMQRLWGEEPTGSTLRLARVTPSAQPRY